MPVPQPQQPLVSPNNGIIDPVWYQYIAGLSTVSGAGTGTVTLVSLVLTNGILGNVATASSTPVISLSLGNISTISITTGNVSAGNITANSLVAALVRLTSLTAVSITVTSVTAASLVASGISVANLTATSITALNITANTVTVANLQWQGVSSSVVGVSTAAPGSNANIQGVTANYVLSVKVGGGLGFQQVPEDGLILTNVTTWNVSTAAHGFCPVLTNSASQFLNGQGAFTVPGSGSTGIFTKSFTSSQQGVTSAALVTVTHALTTTPTLIQTQLKCLSTELGWAAGDVFKIDTEIDPANATGRGMIIYADSTNINVRYGNTANVFVALNKTTGAVGSLTNGNWNLIITAWA